MTAPLLRPAILIISDTASADPSSDKTSSILSAVFTEEDLTSSKRKWADPLVQIIPDSISAIQRAIQTWTDTPVDDVYPNLIITSGGTGFAARDHTPEAVLPLLHRHAPGLVHGMLAASLEVTPFAMMSRPVAGTRHKSVIITLPGSPKGAKENLMALLKLLPHACLQAAGEDSRSAHVGGVRKLEEDAGVSRNLNSAASTSNRHDHSHHHHDHDHSHAHGHSHGHKIPKPHTTPSERPPQSNDPKLGASHRARSSPYPLLSVSDAVSKILSVTPEPTAETESTSTTLIGAYVSSDIHALEAVPAYRASIVDGYAVRIAQTSSSSTTIKGTWPVASISHAAATSNPPPLESGTIARITTGAPLPPNADAVVMVEDTLVASTTADGTEEATVTILTDALQEGENVRDPGSDIKKDSLILPKGTRIGGLGGEIGQLAASGISHTPIYARPRVGVLSTGDEVTDITTAGPLIGGQIRDSNRPSLLSLLSSWNLCASVTDLGIARDTPPGALEEAIRGAFRQHDLDVLITTGGVSMGELDLLKPTVERALGGTIHIGRIAMKPGKPTTFATVPFKPSSSSSSSSHSTPSSSGRRTTRLLFGLPGNPASALVTANLFILPCLQKLAGSPNPTGLPRVRVRLTTPIRCDPQRAEYHRVRVDCDPADGFLKATTTGMQRSSRVGSLSGANALLVLPVREGRLEVGETCEALIMAGFGE